MTPHTAAGVIEIIGKDQAQRNQQSRRNTTCQHCSSGNPPETHNHILSSWEVPSIGLKALIIFLLKHSVKPASQRESRNGLVSPHCGFLFICFGKHFDPDGVFSWLASVMTALPMTAVNILNFLLRALKGLETDLCGCGINVAFGDLVM